MPAVNRLPWTRQSNNAGMIWMLVAKAGLFMIVRMSTNRV